MTVPTATLRSVECANLSPDQTITRVARARVARYAVDVVGSNKPSLHDPWLLFPPVESPQRVLKINTSRKPGLSVYNSAWFAQF